MNTGNRHEATANSKRAKTLGVALCALLFTACTNAEAQQPKKVPRIGLLRLSPTQQIEAIWKKRLGQLGYMDGKNILIEYRSAEGRPDRLPDLAAELVDLKVDVMIAIGPAAAKAAKSVTTTIPIVIAASGDPVKQGLVASLARPGGNITGLTILDPG